MTTISFDGLEHKYKKDRTRILEAIDTALASGKRLRSNLIDEFERNVYARGDTNSIAVSSGTAGLETALRSMGIGPGDKVAVPAFSFAASAGCILAVGAEPLFIDVSENYPFLDIPSLKNISQDRLKAVIAVHLYGTIQPRNDLVDFCKYHNVSLIEDAAQSFGSYSIPENITAEDNHVAVISFDPYKVLPGATGGGVIITKNPKITNALKISRCHGFLPEDKDFSIIGSNAEMSSIDASILLLELSDFEKNNKRRKEIAFQYSRAIQGSQSIETLTVPTILPNNYHKYVVLTSQRADLIDFLATKGIPTKIHYDRALPDYSLFRPYANAEYKHAKYFSERVLSLPIHPEINNQQVKTICNALGQWKHDRG